MTTGTYHLGLYNPWDLALSYEAVLKRFEIDGKAKNCQSPSGDLFFIVLIRARNGVQLERGPFDRRTADYLGMLIFGALSLLVMALIPFLSSPFMASSLVFMIIYVWGREFPNERIDVHGLFQVKGFYLPWYMLGIDLILGNPLKPILLGMAAGHLYYFLTVLYPLAGGSHASTEAQPSSSVQAQPNAAAQPNQANDGLAFRGRSYRLDDHQ
ncbi:hypothetical protein RHGRI_008287 [Rhododendron griersonianum]|uniref:Derlin n=1 Tax=Rhododendron griersonianum TaxID=479676 RepID=A0AAV6L096_9ERIC|nr:hypothetical protein RHGRI_008287 [Rhododendron griersonianum]